MFVGRSFRVRVRSVVYVRARLFTLSCEGEPCRNGRKIGAALAAEGMFREFSHRLFSSEKDFAFVFHLSTWLSSVSSAFLERPVLRLDERPVQLSSRPVRCLPWSVLSGKQQKTKAENEKEGPPAGAVAFQFSPL